MANLRSEAIAYTPYASTHLLGFRSIVQPTNHPPNSDYGRFEDDDVSSLCIENAEIASPFAATHLPRTPSADQPSNRQTNSDYGDPSSSPRSVYYPKQTRQAASKVECYKCRKWFAPSSIAKHKQTHEAGRHLCPNCPRRFRYTRDLTRHIDAVHYHHRNHICDQCGRGFSRSDHLARHIKVHSPRDPSPMLSKESYSEARSTVHPVHTSCPTTHLPGTLSGTPDLDLDGPNEVAFFQERESRFAIRDFRSRSVLDDGLSRNKQKDFSGSPSIDSKLLSTAQDDVESEASSWGESSSSFSAAEYTSVSLSPNAKAYHDKTLLELLQSFRKWQEGTRHTAGGTANDSAPTASSSTATATSTSTGATPSGIPKKDKESFGKGSKRSADDEDGSPTKRGKPDPPGEQDLNRPLACPFAKKDPFIYRKCFGYTKLWTISRLKMHFQREHQIPTHCPRCLQTFKSQDRKDEHLRKDPPCQSLPPVSWEGINEIQKEQLKKRVSSKKSIVENWNLIFRVLFPEVPLPDSPFIEGSGLSDELLAMREWFHQNAPDVVEHTELPPDFRQNSHQMRTFLRGVLHDMFDRLLDDWGRTSTLGSQSPPSQHSRQSLLGVTSPDRLSSNTALTMLSSSPSTRSTEDPSSPILRPSATNLQPLRRLENMEDPGGYDVFQPFSPVYGSLDVESSSMAGSNIPRQNQAELSLFDEILELWQPEMISQVPDQISDFG